jgi:hypothetical protein
MQRRASCIADSPTKPTRSELQIDGANAYPPTQAFFINAGAAGFAALTSHLHGRQDHRQRRDPRDGSARQVRERDLSAQPDQLRDLRLRGVTDDRTITQDHDGHISWVTDTFKSTDSKAHSVDLLWGNNQQFFGPSGDSSQIEYEFPGESGFSTHATGTTVSLPHSAGTILLRMHGAADGAVGTGQGGSSTTGPQPAAKFTSVTTLGSEFTLHQSGNVPAGGIDEVPLCLRARLPGRPGRHACVNRAKTLPEQGRGLEIWEGQGQGDEFATRDSVRQDLHPRLRIRDGGDPQGEGRQGLEVLGLVGGVQRKTQLQGHRERRRLGKGEVRPSQRLTRGSNAQGPTGGVNPSRVEGPNPVAMRPDRCHDAGMPTCIACGQDNPKSRASASRAGLRSPRRRRIARSGGSSASSSSTSSASRRAPSSSTPEDVRAILTPYHGTVRDELESFGGVVEKFVGDAVMAVFGAPTAHGDDP